MPISRQQLETRVRQRIQTIYNNDFDTYIANLLNAKIDEIVASVLNDNIEAIVRSVMLSMAEVQDRLKNSATLT